MTIISMIHDPGYPTLTSSNTTVSGKMEYGFKDKRYQTDYRRNAGLDTHTSGVKMRTDGDERKERNTEDERKFSGMEGTNGKRK